LVSSSLLGAPGALPSVPKLAIGSIILVVYVL
jgi:hypothetical protein